MPSYTLTSLRQQLAQKLYGLDQFAGQPITCDTNATAANVVDASLASDTLSANHFVGWWVFCVTDAAVGDTAPENEARRVVSYTASSGTLVVDPAFSAAVTVSDIVELHPTLHPDRLHEALNRALEEGSNRAFAAVTVTNPDASVTTYDRDILIEGAAYFAKLAMARIAKTGDVRNQLRSGAMRHKEAWDRGLQLLGYRKVAIPTLEERLRRSA